MYAWSIAAAAESANHFYVRYTPTGPTDTIRGSSLVFSAEEPPHPTIVCRNTGGRVSLWPIPFAPRFVEHPAPGGLSAVALTDRYRIAFVDGVGDVPPSITRDRIVTVRADSLGVQRVTVYGYGRER